MNGLFESLYTLMDRFSNKLCSNGLELKFHNKVINCEYFYSCAEQHELKFGLSFCSFSFSFFFCVTILHAN